MNLMIEVVQQENYANSDVEDNQGRRMYAN